jgi:hypothetical protein
MVSKTPQVYIFEKYYRDNTIGIATEFGLDDLGIGV